MSQLDAGISQGFGRQPLTEGSRTLACAPSSQWKTILHFRINSPLLFSPSLAATCPLASLSQVQQSSALRILHVMYTAALRLPSDAI